MAWWYRILRLLELQLGPGWFRHDSIQQALSVMDAAELEQDQSALSTRTLPRLAMQQIPSV